MGRSVCRYWKALLLSTIAGLAFSSPFWLAAFGVIGR